jgi:hypothetical protein
MLESIGRQLRFINGIKSRMTHGFFLSKITHGLPTTDKAGNLAGQLLWNCSTRGSPGAIISYKVNTANDL